MIVARVGAVFRCWGAVLSLMWCSVHADYDIDVHMIAYNNPTNGAAEWEGRCCDDPDADICSGGYRCDNFFIYCLRPYNTPATTDGCGESVHSVISSRESNGGHIDFSGSIALGLPNPLSLAAIGPWLGIQLYIEVVDYDPTNNDDMVESFTVNIPSATPIGYGPALSNTAGLHDLGVISLAATVQCAQFFDGDQCQYLNVCAQTHNICSGHGVCMAEWTGYSCNCYPGFSGENCEISIDDCAGVNCSGINTVCVDGVNSFSCVCQTGFTGKYCTVEILALAGSVGGGGFVVILAICMVSVAIKLVKRVKSKQELVEEPIYECVGRSSIDSLSRAEEKIQINENVLYRIQKYYQGDDDNIEIEPNIGYATSDSTLAVSPLIYDYIDPTTIMESQAGGQETEERIENEVNETNSDTDTVNIVERRTDWVCCIDDGLTS